MFFKVIIMEVYVYHETTKEYFGSAKANVNPRKPDEYLLPAHATFVEPPQNSDPENKMIVWKEEDQKWSIVERPPKPPTEDELERQNFVAPDPMDLLRYERNKRLRNVDWMAMRALSTVGTIPEELKNYMQLLRDLPSSSNPKLKIVDDPYVVLDMDSVDWPFLQTED
jgi:hypothetical protein